MYDRESGWLHHIAGLMMVLTLWLAILPLEYMRHMRVVPSGGGSDSVASDSVLNHLFDFFIPPPMAKTARTPTRF